MSKPSFAPLAYRVSDAVAVSGRTRTRIFGAIRAGELQARKDGKATLIEADELERWVKTFPTIGREGVAAA